MSEITDRNYDQMARELREAIQREVEKLMQELPYNAATAALVPAMDKLLAAKFREIAESARAVNCVDPPPGLQSGVKSSNSCTCGPGLRNADPYCPVHSKSAAILPVPTRFQPGMRIAPGHLRSEVLTLKKHIYTSEFGFEVWSVEEDGRQWCFHPDDLNRVIVEKPKCNHQVDAETDVCVGCGASLDDIKSRIPAEGFETFYDGKPQTEWKVGQMLIDDDGQIIKLVRLERNGWVCQAWIKTMWASEMGACEFRNCVPYPRVGDWVICKGEKHHHEGRDIDFCVVRISMDGKDVIDLQGWCHPIADLEPASPPVEHECQSRGDEPYCYGCGKTREQSMADRPKPTLEGEHWDRAIGMLAKPTDWIDCIVDLRAAVRDLASRLETK